ncbi:helix-turn-helix domain-containing protein, partial [Klebsiella pneumoniae]
MKKITIYDLAELSGVSASAVSAILNGNWKKRRISAKLAEKVTLSWQVDWVVATGATNPDKISALCQQAGVPTVNLDLPGSLSPSVISG